MKKSLFAGLALSVLYSVSVSAQTPPSTQPAAAQPTNTPALTQSVGETAPASIMALETDARPQTPEQPAASSTQTAPAPQPNQIANAIEIGILYGGFDALTPPHVEQKGQDFIISIPQTQMTNADGVVQQFPAAQIQMTRVDDFDGHAQYKMQNITLPYVKSILSALYPQSNMTQDTFQEEVLWVPDLALRTKQSLKAENVHFDNGLGVQLKIGSFYSDGLIGSKTDHKMDAASSVDMRDLTLQTNVLKLTIPHLSAETQTLDADQTADMLQQTLSAALSRGTLSIPKINLTPLTPLFAPLDMRSDVRVETVQDPTTHEIQTHLVLDNTLLNLSMQDFESGALPALFPEDIKADIVLSGLNAAQIQSIATMQGKLDEAMDEESEQSVALQNEIQKQMNDALDKVRLNINEIVLENPVAAIRFSGTGRFINQTAQLNGQLAITNFDLISPDYKAQCAAERAKQPKTDKQPAVTAEPAACISVGVLDSLRPYLDSAEKSMQNGKETTLFKIEYKNGQAYVNNRPFHVPSMDDTETDAMPLASEALK